MAAVIQQAVASERSAAEVGARALAARDTVRQMTGQNLSSAAVGHRACRLVAHQELTAGAGSEAAARTALQVAQGCRLREDQAAHVAAEGTCKAMADLVQAVADKEADKGCTAVELVQQHCVAAAVRVMR